MKKAIAIILTLALTLTLAACGIGDTGSTTPSSDIVAPDSQPASEATPASDQTPNNNISAPDGGGSESNAEPEWQSGFTLIHFETEPPNPLSFYVYFDEDLRVSGYEAFSLNAQALPLSTLVGLSWKDAIHTLVREIYDSGYSDNAIWINVLTDSGETSRFDEVNAAIYRKIASLIDQYAADNGLQIGSVDIDAETDDQARFEIQTTGSSQLWPSDEILNQLPMPDRYFEVSESNVNGPGYHITIGGPYSSRPVRGEWLEGYVEIIKAKGFTTPDWTYGAGLYYEGENSNDIMVTVRDGGDIIGVNIYMPLDGDLEN